MYSSPNYNLRNYEIYAIGRFLTEYNKVNVTNLIVKSRIEMSRNFIAHKYNVIQTLKRC